MTPNFEIISTLLAMFIVAVSIFAASRAMRHFMRFKRLRNFKKYTKQYGNIEILAFDHMGTPTVVSTKDGIKVL